MIDIHVYTELNWMQVRERDEYFKNILMYKCVHGLAPEYLSIGIQSQMNTHSYNTRSNTSNNISHFAMRTEIGKRSFKYSGGRSWNNLPLAIRSLPTILTFKKHVKEHI